VNEVGHGSNGAALQWLYPLTHTLAPTDLPMSPNRQFRRTNPIGLKYDTADRETRRERERWRDGDELCSWNSQVVSVSNSLSVNGHKDTK